MKAFIFSAALLCEDCGDKVRADLKKAGNAPADRDNESTYDSDDYPKGPYGDGGGEADCPCHCDHCGVHLENPLTDDGYAYVRQALGPWVAADDSDPDGPQSDGMHAYGKFVAQRIRDEAESLRLPQLDLGPEESARRVIHADTLEEVTAVWADFYPEAWDKRNGGPI